MDLSQQLAALWEASPFRSGIHLTAGERTDLEGLGPAAMAERARPLIIARLGPAAPPNDGRQTPWHGFPAFPAQHATATCCRVCLAKHYGIPTGTPLSEPQIEQILACLRLYWERELATERPCECRRCRQWRAAGPGHGSPKGRRARRAKDGSLALALDSVPPPEHTVAPTPNAQRSAPASRVPAASQVPADAPPLTTGYNDLDLRRWKEHTQIETGSLWLFGSRDRGGGHRLHYHGNFIPQIATQTFLRFSRRGEIVLDPFLGGGTSAIEACRLGRRCVGVELRADLVEAINGQLAAPVTAGHVALLHGDSGSEATIERVRAQLATWGAERAHLLMLHPPYHDIIRFTGQPEDLCNAPSVEAFIERFTSIARAYRALLERRRFAVLVIGDKYARGELVPLGFRCMQAMNDAGFRTRSIVVKNIEGNEIGKGRDSNLWRYRALRGGFYLFKHEYVMIFQNP